MPTVERPNSVAARKTRIAISDRLAARSLRMKVGSGQRTVESGKRAVLWGERRVLQAARRVVGGDHHGGTETRRATWRAGGLGFQVASIVAPSDVVAFPLMDRSNNRTMTVHQKPISCTMSHAIATIAVIDANARN